MVLLTPSTVSALITGSIVCTFTFLLFLSGYVLQQRTVESLREAIRAPPAPKPVPTLPAKFRVSENGTDIIAGTPLEPLIEGSVNEGSEIAFVEVQDQKPTPQIDEAADSLAYLLTLPEPSDLCSAVLFAKWQRQFANLNPYPSIIILYPTVWEIEQTPTHVAALTFMRDMQEEYALQYHPVDLNPALAGVSINSQLLGELQRKRWDFDRAMYLKSPGLPLDMGAIDRTLASTDVEKLWAPLSAAAGHDPTLLLWSRTRGLMMARGDTQHLAVSALTKHEDHHANEMDVEATAENAAYVIFDETELEHRRMERDWFGGVFERFERERDHVCKGKGLIPGEEDRLDLRRKP